MKKIMVVMAFVIMSGSSFADNEWMHETPDYIKDGEMSLDFEGEEMKFDRNTTQMNLSKQRARDVRVVVKKVVHQDPWSLRWSDNTVR